MEQLKNESSRQYEYMEEMKKWVQKKDDQNFAVCEQYGSRRN